MLRRVGIAAALILAALVFTAPPASAQDQEFGNGAWINGGPYKLKELRGKIVVLYFFEQG